MFCLICERFKISEAEKCVGASSLVLILYALMNLTKLCNKVNLEGQDIVCRGTMCAAACLVKELSL